MITCKCRIIVAVSFFIAVATALFDSIWAVANETTMIEIEKAWKRNERRAGSLDIEWRADFIKPYPKKSGKLTDNPFHPPPRDEPYDYSRPAVVADLEYRLTVRGHRISFEKRDYGNKNFPHPPYLEGASYDGKIVRSFFELINPTRPKFRFQGRIYESSTSVDTIQTRAELSPPLVAYYPLTHGQISLSKFRIFAKREAVDDADCVRIRAVSGRPVGKATSYEQVLWLDVDMGYVIRRSLVSKNDLPLTQINFDYKRAIGGVASLSGWKQTFFLPSGRFDQEFAAKVTKLSVNEPVDLNRFHLTFPPQTMVFDERKRDKKNSPEVGFIQVSEEARRPVFREELLRTRGDPEQLLNAEPGRAGLEERNGFSWWTLALISMVAALAVLVVLRARGA